jgi:hypothetical protein
MLFSYGSITGAKIQKVFGFGNLIYYLLTKKYPKDQAPAEALTVVWRGPVL